jgi:hypothetical protein
MLKGAGIDASWRLRMVVLPHGFVLLYLPVHLR